MHLHNSSGTTLNCCRFIIRQNIHKRSGIAHLRNGVIPNAKPVEKNLAILISFKDNLIAVCTGNAERKTFDLAVRGGFNDPQIATHCLIDKADARFILDLIGLAVRVDHHLIHVSIENKAIRCFGFLDKVATVEQVVHSVFADFFFSQCAEQLIAVVQLAIVIAVLVNLKYCSSQLVIGILGIHLGQMNVATAILVDNLNLYDLTVCANRHRIDGIIQHEACGLFNLTDIPSAARDILKRKTTFFGRSGSHQSVFLCKLAVIRAKQPNHRTAESVAVLINLLAGNRTINQVIFDCLTSAIVSKPGTELSVKDLKGKQVVGPKGTFLHQLLVAALEKEGMRESDVQFINMGIPKALSTILAGHADAALVASGALIKANKAGAKTIINAEGLVEPTLVMTTTKQFAEEHPDIVKRVDKVYAESLRWMKDHPSETAEMGAKEHGISIEDAKTLMERSHYFDKMTTKDLEDLKVNQKFLRDNGMMRNEVTVEELVLPVAME